jgi:hypothetical protein
LDTACTHALLQEKAELPHRREFRRSDYGIRSKQTAVETPLPLPPLPSRMDKSLGGSSSSADRRVTEVVLAVQADNKVAALCAYRRAKGLCQFCAEKWDRGHKCEPTIQLQPVPELWEMLSVDSDCDYVSGHSSSDSQLHMILSKEVVLGVASSKTLKFLGSIQGHHVVIMIDSGSSHSFVNSSLSSALVGISPTGRPV